MAWTCSLKAFLTCHSSIHDGRLLVINSHCPSGSISQRDCIGIKIPVCELKRTLLPHAPFPFLPFVFKSILRHIGVTVWKLNLFFWLWLSHHCYLAHTCLPFPVINARVPACHHMHPAAQTSVQPAHGLEMRTPPWTLPQWAAKKTIESVST